MRQPCPKPGVAGTGFTLIELLVVVAVLGTIMALILPRLFSTGVSAQINACSVAIKDLAGVARSHDTETGDFPRDSLALFPREFKVKVDKTNPGIEAFLIDLALARTPSGTTYLDDLRSSGNLCNQDEDKAGALLGYLESMEQYEVQDPWGGVLVYFHHRGYGTAQEVSDPLGAAGSGETVTVKAVTDPTTGRYYEPHRFQIISAGPDMEFGTDDDIHNFKKRD